MKNINPSTDLSLLHALDIGQQQQIQQSSENLQAHISSNQMLRARQSPYSDAYPAANWLTLRSFSPYTQSNNGAGTPIPNEINPSKLLPHPKSKPLYMAGAKSGNKNPAKLLNTVVAAMPLAAYRV